MHGQQVQQHRVVRAQQQAGHVGEDEGRGGEEAQRCVVAGDLERFAGGGGGEEGGEPVHARGNGLAAGLEPLEPAILRGWREETGTEGEREREGQRRE